MDGTTAEAASAPGPLSGIRIVDLSQWQQGPYATVVLSDMGAEVVKVERPHVGDAGRHGMGGADARGVAPDFFAHNRGKRGITADLAHPDGREVVLRLVERADVLVHNFRPGTMERWGLGYADVRRRNPRLIYAHASGAGTRGPRAAEPSFDIVAQAAAGIMSVTGEEGTAPHPVGTFQADQVGALMLACSILGALVARERAPSDDAHSRAGSGDEPEGGGQSVGVSLLGTQLALQSFELTHHLFTGEPTPRAGRGHPHTDLLWNTFPAADGYFVTAGVTADRWGDLCEVLGAADLLDDPRFRSREERIRHRAPLTEVLDAHFRRRPVAHWLDVLPQLGIPCGPVNDYAAVAGDPQVWANGYLGEMDHPELGTVGFVRTPIDYGRTPVAEQGPPPQLGQHTEEVLLELGYDWPQILDLRDRGAV